MVAASFGGYTTAKKEFRQLVTIFSPFATIVLGCYRTPVVRVRIRHTVVRVQARNTDIGTVVRTTHHHGNVSQYRYPPIGGGCRLAAARFRFLQSEAALGRPDCGFPIMRQPYHRLKGQSGHRKRPHPRCPCTHSTHRSTRTSTKHRQWNRGSHYPPPRE